MPVTDPPPPIDVLAAHDHYEAERRRHAWPPKVIGLGALALLLSQLYWSTPVWITMVGIGLFVLVQFRAIRLDMRAFRVYLDERDRLFSSYTKGTDTP